ncbi:MAG: D-alanyl-D-alanine carboxypeptidase family protein [Candidatus Omnitrophota bacterium]
MSRTRRPLSALFVLLLFLSLISPLHARSRSTPALSARSAVIMDHSNGKVLYGKNPHLRLPPASTTKVMTVLIALEKLPLHKPVLVSSRAWGVAPSKAGLTRGATYRAGDLMIAAIVASSNDAAVALAEAAAGTETEFVKLMNARAKKLGMKNTQFLNATGLPVKKTRRKQFTTAYDLSKLMRHAAKDRWMDAMMGITYARFRGSDGRYMTIKSHNKMLWRTPKFVKGKTGWTFASRHTFVGTNYAPQKKIIFAMLSSQKPWVDIEKLARFGLALKVHR